MAVTANGHRFDASGRNIEDSEFSVNIVGDSVYLHIQGAKKVQSWMMKLPEWENLTRVTQRSAWNRKSYAVCDDAEHVQTAMFEMAGTSNVEIRRVSGHERGAGNLEYTCHCGKPADFFLLEK